MPWLLLASLLGLSQAALQALGLVAVAVVGAAATYFLGRRSTSGSIETSAASDLWTESRAIRTELTQALKQERQERAADRVRFEADLQVERGERIRLEGALLTAERDNRELRERVAVLEARADE
jgi:flagellar motility protein MotE (MotC chaperone)